MHQVSILMVSAVNLDRRSLKTNINTTNIYTVNEPDPANWLRTSKKHCQCLQPEERKQLNYLPSYSNIYVQMQVFLSSFPLLKSSSFNLLIFKTGCHVSLSSNNHTHGSVHRRIMATRNGAFRCLRALRLPTTFHLIRTIEGQHSSGGGGA